MNHKPSFVDAYRAQANALLKAHAVKEPIFSRGTYQVEVQEKGKKKAFPFLQMKDDGLLSDFFCSCKLSETGEGCPHLAAAYLRIFNGFEEPLHVRFKHSFWNRICQMLSKRYGYDSSCLMEAAEKGFSIEPKNLAVKNRLEQIVAKRPVETEETSIKFSNLSTGEIEQYRLGKASHSLRYELSFWSDLAKWLMYLQDEKEPYELSFKGSPLPSEITISFPYLEIWVTLYDLNLPWIIPSLSTVKSPLAVFSEEDFEIESIVYDEKRRCLCIQHKTRRAITGIRIGDWEYVEGKGFYRRSSEPILQEREIPAEKIAAILPSKIAKRFLPIHKEIRKAQYELYFDKKSSLHIQLYVETPKDMQSERASCFIPWAYVPERGFFHLEDWFFETKEKVIAKEQVADFVGKHRLWLHQFPGFQTHLGSLESHLVYTLTPEGDLVFDAELNFPEKYAEALHFDEWSYIPGQGFYMKKEGLNRLPFHPGQRVKKEELSQFIHHHEDELEQVKGFFSSTSPIQKTGLHVGLNQEGLITVFPKVEYAPGIDPGVLKMFGDYVYLEGKGFSEIPPAARLPERYSQEVVIPASQETAFLTYELEPLRPFIIEIEPGLVKPNQLQLKIRKIQKKGKEWLVDLYYQSELGVLDVFSIWDSLQQKKRHLFSSAGLFSLKEPRFNWIRQLSKKRLDRKRRLIRLNTMEWLRLTALEPIDLPQGESPEELEMRNLLDELDHLQTDRLLDISRLKATLRPYQEQGLRWLWFLYCYGLSGLLCDDMGLGKTHQTMALLAAVTNEDEEKKNKYLVVCPTSVIYHWQELLKKFLPDVRVCTYYGLERTLAHFDTDYDLLLTSYGILRSAKNEIQGLQFELSIFDEIQIAKNHASQTHKALRMIHSQMRLGLTGTPIENRLRELKALIDVVLPSYMPPDPVFRDVFINPIEKQHDEEKKALLARLIKPFLLRRKKSEVLTDLPEKIEEIAYSDLSSEQKDLYTEVAVRMKNTVYQDLKNKDKPVSFIHVFSALSSLKQICDHPALVLEDTKNYAAHSSGKWDLFIELIEEARGSGQKIVVFSQYLEMLHIIELYLKKKGIGYASIKGSTRDRPEQLKKFRDDPECTVFVASLLAAGVGIDLTVASIVIHYDRWWNPAKENQATDRVHRIGQNRGVQVFKLVTKNTIEEHIHEMIERKKGLIEDIVGESDQINYLSREELLAVFEKMFQDFRD